jgi:hypothetical protein
MFTPWFGMVWAQLCVSRKSGYMRNQSEQNLPEFARASDVPAVILSSASVCAPRIAIDLSRKNIYN